MYQYELENIEKSINLLANTHAVNPEYNLAILLTRAIKAGWPSDTFATMRNELASKVEETIAEQADEVIE